MSVEGSNDNEQISYLKQRVAELEECLFKSEEKFRSVADSAPVGLFLDNAEGKATYINKKCAELIGVDPEVALELNWIPYLHPDDRDLMVSEWQRCFTSGSEFRLEYRWVHEDGKIVWTLGEVIPIKDENGEVILFIGSLTDITSRKEAELEKENLQAQLNQAQKLESVGRLAGGVAHDFNNMLNAIMGYTELAAGEVDSGSKVYGMLEEILKAAKRSAEITGQLLRFSRKQVVTRKVFEVNDSIEEMHNMLCRLIGDEITILCQPCANSALVEMDPSQFDQMVVNLCINARDAIDGIGQITLEISKQVIDESDCAKHPEYLPGDFVLLTVKDNGSGMDEATLEKIFEPFFTTKGENEGTGLGLASVYGTVKQNGGFIIVDSEPGSGTTFNIYLPQVQKGIGENEESLSAKLSEGGGETILVVEDEHAILEIVNLVLETSNYNVLTANNALDAMTLAENFKGSLDMLLTDVIMPDVNGRDLALKIGEKHPQMRCLYMSGYTADILGKGIQEEDSFNFIQKPFGTQELLTKVQEVLLKNLS